MINVKSNYLYVIGVKSVPLPKLRSYDNYQTESATYTVVPVQ